MALCSLCQNTPFSSLPSPPDPRAGTRVGDKKELVQILNKDTEKPIGFPWHEHLDALAASAANGCPVCALVQVGVQRWTDVYCDVAQNSKVFREFQQDHNPFPSGQKLWLTRRYGEGDGFIVIVKNPKLESGVYLLAGVGFSADSNSQLADVMPLRPLESSSGSPKSLAVAATWIKKCLDDHEGCSEGDASLPSRVLDIGTSGDVIKLLVETEGISGKYASLSYCWGTSPEFITTKESFEERQSGIRLSSLPKTFYDAVTIARHLGLRYLWIDSLCILQDDTDDWARESVRMIDVYSKAHVVISANHASDKTVGCFNQRSLCEGSVISLPLAKSQGSMDQVHATVLRPNCESPFFSAEFQSQPLAGRGWALQERALSRRTIHYNSEQMFFECNHGVVGEDGCRAKMRCYSINDTVDENSKHTEANQEPNRATWNRLLAAYGRRELTRPADKLPAMSGLARIFEQRFKAEYVAGLWSDALIEGLAWQGLGVREAMHDTEYIGPSWSWASYHGIPATGLREGWADIAGILDWHVELENEANPYGQVKNASIRVRAPLARLFPSEVNVTDHEKRLTNVGITPLPRLCTKYSDDEGPTPQTSLDHRSARDSGKWRDWDMYILLLGGYNITPAEGQPDWKRSDEQSYGLVLVEDPSGQEKGEKRMKRVGWKFVPGEEAEKIRNDEKVWTVVTLV